MKKVITEIVPNSVIAKMELAVTPWMVPVTAGRALSETNVRTRVTPGSMGQGVHWIAHVTKTTRRIAATGTDNVFVKVDIRYTKKLHFLNVIKS